MRMGSHIVIYALTIYLEFESNTVFLGDLEYCCARNCLAPTNLKRSDPNAHTAEDLDRIQLEKLKDELADL
jgi:hypothetical protein